MLRPRCAWPLLCTRACLMRVWLRTRGLGACACAVQLVASPARRVASLHCFACCVSGCFFAHAFGCYLLMGRMRSCSARMLDVCNVRRPRPLQIDICDPASFLARAKAASTLLLPAPARVQLPSCSSISAPYVRSARVQGAGCLSPCPRGIGRTAIGASERVLCR